MKKWLSMIVVIALLCICSGTIWFIQTRYFHIEPLSEAEAIRHVEKIYKGRVTQVKKQGNTFEMVFTRDNTKYAAVLDATTQQMTDLTMTEGQSKLLLTEKQIRQMAKQEFDDVENVMLTDSIYTVRVEKENRQKEITLDGYSGEILSEKDVELERPVKEPIISERQAIQIALEQLNGEVDSVDFEETSEGGYYLVEIETQDNEATFQIHAVSGKVLSVTWDDDQ